MNKFTLGSIAAFFAMAMSIIRSQPCRGHQHNSNRAKAHCKRGYMLNGQRVYFRPACKWVPNKKGLRWEMGVCVDRKTGRPV